MLAVVHLAYGVRLDAPPRLIQEKHISLKLSSTRSRPFKAVAWRSAERFAQSQLLAGDTLDIAFTLAHNDHPDFGGLELTLRDFRKTNN